MKKFYETHRVRSRVLTSLVAIALTLLLFSILPTNLIHLRGRWIIASILLMATLGLAAALARTPRVDSVSHEPQWTDKPPDPIPETTEDGIDIDFAQYAKRYFAYRYKSSLIPRIIDCICNPRAYNNRITENLIESSDDTLHQSVSRLIQLAPTELAVIPVTRPRKGKLLDHFRVSCDGENVSTLTYLEGLGAMLLAIEVFFGEVFPEERYPDEELRRAALDQCLINCGSQSRVGVAEREMLRCKILQLVGSGKKGRSLYLPAFADLLESLQDNYYVFAVVENIGKFRVKVTTEATMHRSDGFIGPLVKVRRLLGLPRRGYDILLPLSGETQSYHLNLYLPTGTYLYDHTAELVELDMRSNLRRTLTSSVPPSLMDAGHPHMDYSGTGRGFYHLYTSDPHFLFAGANSSNARMGDYFVACEVAFREIPPGSLSVLLPLAVYLLLVVWFTGHFFGKFFPSSGTASNATSNWLAVLVGLPAVVAGLVVARLTSERIRTMSLLTCVMLSWLGANSVLALVISASKIGRKTSGQAFSLGWFGSVHHGWWVLLMMSVGLNVMVMLVGLIFRTKNYWSALRGS
jgi:hypothetical protein